MNAQTLPQWVVGRIRQRPILFGLVALAVIVLAVVLFKSSRKPAQTYSYYEARRGDFLVSIVEGGALEAVNEVSIRNEVEGSNARIIYIVPEGSYVSKGDLLVELDSSSSQDTVNQQQINMEKADFTVKQAAAQLEIQKSLEDSNLQAASNRVEFAATDLRKYIEGETLQARRNAEIEITNVVESLQLAEDSFRWSEQLYRS